jgi:hypothetical protein
MVSPVSDPESPPVSTGNGDPPRLEEAASSLGQEANAIWSSLMRSLDLQRRALGLRLFDAAWFAGIGVLGAVAVVIAAATATFLLLAGARRGMAAWTENAWWSDLVLGAVLAAALCIGLYSLQRIVHRSALKQVQRKLSSR